MLTLTIFFVGIVMGSLAWSAFHPDSNESRESMILLPLCAAIAAWALCFAMAAQR